MLNPIIPHMTHTLWQTLNLGDNIAIAPWPQVDETALIKSEVMIVIQINGKVRGRLDIGADWDESQVKELVLNDSNIQKHLDGKVLKKFIYVPNKLVSLVI